MRYAVTFIRGTTQITRIAAAADVDAAIEQVLLDEFDDIDIRSAEPLEDE